MEDLRLLFTLVATGLLHGTLKQGTEVGGSVFLGAKECINLGLFLLIGQVLDRKSDFALRRVDVQDNGFSYNFV